MAIIPRRDKKKLQGIEKTATMLLALPDETVGKILSHMDPEEIREVSQAMVSLGTINPKAVEGMFSEFLKEITSTGVLVGGLDSVQRVFGKNLSQEHLNSLMEDLKGPGGKTLWEKLSHVNEQFLSNYLRNEHPQTIAVILTRIHPENASKILAILPESLTTEVTIRMVRLDSVRKEVLEDIEKNLKEQFISNLDRLSTRDNYMLLAEIFNNFDHSTEVRIFSKLSERQPEIAERIRSLMFNFEDLYHLDNKALQVLIQNIDKMRLALALKGIDEVFRNAFLSNMSDRAARLLLDDMRELGSVRVKDVEEAQAHVVSIAKELEASGVISLGRNKGDADVQLVE